MTNSSQTRREEIEARKRMAYTSKVESLLGHVVYDRVSSIKIMAAYAAGTLADDFAAAIASQEPVGHAVHPTKFDAVKRAALGAQEIIERVAADLEVHSWDSNAAAPFPRSTHHGRVEYATRRAKYDRYILLTKSADGRGSHRPDQPRFVVMDPDGCSRFISECEKMAAAQYDAFIVKLVYKVGPCVSASLEGSHVWGRSTLTVTKADGPVERWFTQQIVNVSSRGLLFNQWPTRKVK
jgi:hypothetical protein